MRGRGKNRKKPTPQTKEVKPKRNREIRAYEVRLVGDPVNNAIVSIDRAVEMAEERGLDLVEISPNAEPPVCKILDYQKYLYLQKKKQKEMRTNTAKVVVKEVRFGPNTDEHDFSFKLRHAQKFLEEGNKVRAYVFFRGRSILFKDKGEILLLRFAQELEDYATVDQLPKIEGSRMNLLLSPKK